MMNEKQLNRAYRAVAERLDAREPGSDYRFSRIRTMDKIVDMNERMPPNKLAATLRLPLKLVTKVVAHASLQKMIALGWFTAWKDKECTIPCEQMVDHAN